MGYGTFPLGMLTKLRINVNTSIRVKGLSTAQTMPRYACL